MKLLFVIMAVSEATTGAVLLLMPGMATSVLLGLPLEDTAGLTAARIAGAALFALAIACWSARNSDRGGTAKGIVAAMVFYNEAAAFILAYVGILRGQEGSLVWPLFVLHQSLAIWCTVNFWLTNRRLAKGRLRHTHYSNG